MELFQVFLSFLMGFVVALFFVTAMYKRKKQREYGNDERWKSIVASVMTVLYHYHVVVLTLVALGNAVYRMLIANYLGIDVQVRMDEVFALLYVVLLGGSAVELIAFRVYDKKM